MKLLVINRFIVIINRFENKIKKIGSSHIYSLLRVLIGSPLFL